MNRNNKPPRFAGWLMKRLSHQYHQRSVLGDLEEVYYEIAEDQGVKIARKWYWRQPLMSIKHLMKSIIYWSTSMFKNYLKVIFRNIKRNKGYSFLNITGLVIGISCSILIFLYIQFELSYDRYHENADDIYRVLIRQPGESFQGVDMYNTSPPPLKAAILNDYPEIKSAARIIKIEQLFKSNDNTNLEREFFIVDPEFLQIFTYPLITGDPETALNEPFSILMTEEMAEKYFGDDDPIGQILNVDGKYEYKVTGILKNIPDNSHFKFDFLGSFNTLYTTFSNRDANFFTDWNKYLFKTYFQVNPNIDPEEFNSRFPVNVGKYRGRATSDEIHIQPLTGIHLSGNVNRELENNSDIRYIYLFSAVAFLIVLIACFNYMNLCTAHSVKRLKEVGIRKVAGAGRYTLMLQFIGESLIITILSVLISILTVKMFLPEFSAFIGQDLNNNFLSNGALVLTLVSLTIFTGIVSGGYPAFFLSSYKPVNMVKGIYISNSGKNKSSALRNTLVVIQFVITIVMIISTITIYNQLNFIRDKNLGFQKDYIVTIPIHDKYLRDNYEVLKKELIQYTEILNVSASNHLPSAIISSGGASWAGKTRENSIDFKLAVVDHDFLDFYEIELLNGRDFSEEISTDVEQAYILNESAVKSIGWEEPIGKRFNFQRNINGQVVGVVKNFHCSSLHQKIEPLVIGLIKPESWWWSAQYLSVKISSEDISGTLALIEEKYKEFSTEYPFSFSFLDDNINTMYRLEQKLGQSFIYFSIIAILIASLGLFGLVSLTAEQKTKEIGIRRALGASASSIVLSLGGEFIRWIAVATIFAWPLGYIAMNSWLQNFAYKTDISMFALLFSAAITIIIAAITISTKTFKAARTNPVDSLRYE
ncbi:MAG: hypothetical protein GY863_08170 [bacterium]|nr:hypothetical protein [bacterium]